jgi:hypothetical protein
LDPKGKYVSYQELAMILAKTVTPEDFSYLMLKPDGNRPEVMEYLRHSASLI